MSPSSRPRLADRAAEVLGESGPIARAMASSGVRYEARPGQVTMARAVADAIEHERVLMCEAGTGTGKTLAYLVPAILSGRRVVVSTATKALQEQVYTKDVPLLCKHLAPLGISVTASLMKGLNNYVCRRRLMEALATPQPFAAKTLARIEAWVRESETGDRVELGWLRDDDPAFYDVQSASDTRIGQGCFYHDQCFVTKMRAAAEQARVVVVNHHLYLADLALRAGTKGRVDARIIPPHDVVVFDEAHQLEEIAGSFFGVRVSSGRVETLLRDVRRTLLSHRKAIESSRVDELMTQLDAVSHASTRFFECLAALPRPEGETRSAVSREAISGDVVEQRGRLDAALEALEVKISHLDKDSSTKEALSQTARRVGALRSDLAVLVAPAHDQVPWLEVRSRSVAFGVSPLDPASVLSSCLFGRPSSEETVPAVEDDDDDVPSSERGNDGPVCLVFTSATLTVAPKEGRGDRFHHGKRRVGLVDGRGNEVRASVTLEVPSPFDYTRRAGLYVPIDLPEPREPDYLEQAADRVVSLIAASRGGAFVLCTSTNAMTAFHGRLAKTSLPGPLLCQGERPKAHLLDDFRRSGDAVLVATMGFWEGVDVPGRALRLVVLDKLPFPSPGDPVFSARMRMLEARGRSSFHELSVPEAAIALKQGFGRLVRTASDAGVVAILDRRLRTRPYGARLLRGLPPAARLRELDEVRVFLALHFAADDRSAPDSETPALPLAANR